ncbi:hypothetical protein ACFYOF_20785 [Streptomyces sp. NPDC007148]|uniref:hypothetical protein n=1 Tax=Streptomyces sp. NPDC007148 TaxID=3364775 RepID=UPI003674CC09
MHHRSAGRTERKTNETSLTLRKRNRLIAGSVAAAALTLGVSVVTGAVTPDAATAVATVSSAAIGILATVFRRTPAVAQDEEDPVRLDK